MFSSTEKMVDVGGFPIPVDQADTFRTMREEMATAAAEVLQTFCVKVERKVVDDILGEGVVGYASDGEEEARVSLDPFEVSAMHVAQERGKLLEYILAANGLPYAYYEQQKQAVQTNKG